MPTLTNAAMEATIRRYFDGCNEADLEKMTGTMTEDAIHYFPPGMYDGPFRGAMTIAKRWADAVDQLGSYWTVDSFIGDAERGIAVIEWSHFKTEEGSVLRGDEWYRFEPNGLISEIRAYYATPQDPLADRARARRVRLRRTWVRAAGPTLPATGRDGRAALLARRCWRGSACGRVWQTKPSSAPSSSSTWIPRPCAPSRSAAFDFVIVDLEHSSAAPADIAPLVAVAAAVDLPVIVRVSDPSQGALGKVLDLAPAGVMIPRIRTPDEAAIAVRGCRFPPVGTRGYSPLTHFAGAGVPHRAARCGSPCDRAGRDRRGGRCCRRAGGDRRASTRSSSGPYDLAQALGTPEDTDSVPVRACDRHRDRRGWRADHPRWLCRGSRSLCGRLARPRLPAALCGVRRPDAARTGGRNRSGAPESARLDLPEVDAEQAGGGR